MKFNKKIAGLVPAAGYANRIAPLPCSKEIYPVAYRDNSVKSPKVISAFLFEKFRNAGLQEIYVIIRKGKWDIPQYFGTGSSFGLNIAYLVVNPTQGTSHTINEAFHFIRDKRILLGFPDILMSHKNPFQKLLIQLDNSGADVVLGLFKTDNPQKGDMVETDKDGMIKNLIIKPGDSDLKYTWLLAVWDPIFTDFLHDFLSNHQSKDEYKEKKELHIGHTIQEAIKNGLKVDSVKFPDSTFIDIGTIDDLQKAIKLNL